MLEINHSLEVIVEQIPELKHIEQASQKSNVSIRINMNQIIENIKIHIDLEDEYKYR